MAESDVILRADEAPDQDVVLRAEPATGTPAPFYLEEDAPWIPLAASLGILAIAVLGAAGHEELPQALVAITIVDEDAGAVVAGVATAGLPDRATWRDDELAIAAPAVLDDEVIAPRPALIDRPALVITAAPDELAAALATIVELEVSAAVPPAAMPVIAALAYQPDDVPTAPPTIVAEDDWQATITFAGMTSRWVPPIDVEAPRPAIAEDDPTPGTPIPTIAWVRLRPFADDDLAAATVLLDADGWSSDAASSRSISARWIAYVDTDDQIAVLLVGTYGLVHYVSAVELGAHTARVAPQGYTSAARAIDCTSAVIVVDHTATLTIDPA